MKVKEKGFTLVELIAVIILLGIIALIAIPAVNTTIKNTRKSTFENSAYGVIEAGKLYYQNRELLGLELNDTTFTFPEATGLEVNGDKPESGKMLLTSKGNIKLAISNGKYCARKGYETSKITIDEDITNCTLESIGEESTDIKDCECEECICEECPVIEDIKITELVLSAESVSIIPNGTYQINDSAKPINASNKTLSYKSNDESIAIVNELGIITGIKAGETSITVTTTDGSNISKTVDVIVREQIQNVTLDKTEVEIKVGESINIIPTITPTTAAIKTLKWESSDTSIAIVENGIIGGLGVGTTTITASTQDGTNITKTINVKVLEAGPNVTQGTATEADVLSGKTFYASDNELKTGELVKGKYGSFSVTYNGQSVTINLGFKPTYFMIFGASQSPWVKYWETFNSAGNIVSAQRAICGTTDDTGQQFSVSYQETSVVVTKLSPSRSQLGSFNYIAF